MYIHICIERERDCIITLNLGAHARGAAAATREVRHGAEEDPRHAGLTIDNIK